MDAVQAVASKSKKVTKPTATSLSKPTAAAKKTMAKEENTSLPDVMNFDDLLGSDIDASLDDLGLDLDLGSSYATSQDLGYDETTTQPQVQWPWCDTPDWTLLEPPSRESPATLGLGSQQSLSPSSPRLPLFNDAEMTQYSSMDEPYHGTRDALSGQQPSRQRLQAGVAEAIGHPPTSVNPSALHDRQGQQDTARLGSDLRRRRFERRSLEANGTIAIGSQALPYARLIQSNTATDSRANQRSPSLPTEVQVLDERHLLFDEDEKQNDIEKRRIVSQQRGLGTHSAPGTSKRMMQDEHPSRTLGEGLDSNIDPGTQLFLLKRRLPKSLHSIVDRNNNGEASDTALRLQTSPRLQTRQASLAIAGTADGAVHTRPRTVSANSSSGASIQSAGPGHQQQGPYDDRLSDHFRRRDHFGRMLSTGMHCTSEGTAGSLLQASPLALHILAVLIGLLLLSFVSSCQGCSVSMLLLALVAPTVDEKDSKGSVAWVRWPAMARWPIMGQS